MNTYVVYVHINKTNGKKYVGITKNCPSTRWDHGRGYKKNPHFYSAIEKYGWDNFEHKILHSNLTKEEACTLEIKYIAEWNTQDNNFGYNMLEGGTAPALTDEIRCKIGDKNRTHGDSHSKLHQIWIEMRMRHKNNYTKEWDDYLIFKEWALNNGFDAKKSLYQIDNSLPYSPENCEWCPEKSKNAKRRYITYNGETHCLKDWEKIYSLKKGTLSHRLFNGWSEEDALTIPADYNTNCKPVMCVETGEKFNSISDANISTGICFNSISAACKNERKTAGNLHWKYI